MRLLRRLLCLLRGHRFRKVYGDDLPVRMACACGATRDCACQVCAAAARYAARGEG